MNMTTIDRTTRAARLTLFSACLALLATPLSLVAETGNGQRLYLAHCAGCHGENGVSILPQAPSLARVALFAQPDQTLVDVVRDGRNAMPSYLGILQDGEILDVVGYLRTFR